VANRRKYRYFYFKKLITFSQTMVGGYINLTLFTPVVVTGTCGGEEASPDLPDLSTPTQIIFPREAVREAVLLLVREKTSRFSTVRVRKTRAHISGRQTPGSTRGSSTAVVI
jgi:hypothetical protein